MYFEEKAQRLAHELDRGDTREATDILRHELYENPREALALIQRARQMESPRGVDDVYVKSDGDVMIFNKYNQDQSFVGKVPIEPQPPVVYQPAPPPVVYRNDNGAGEAAAAAGGVLLGGALGYLLGRGDHGDRGGPHRR